VISSLNPFPCKASANPTSRSETRKKKKKKLTSHENVKDMTVIERKKEQCKKKKGP
jgi:hypothetical protein